MLDAEPEVSRRPINTADTGDATPQPAATTAAIEFADVTFRYRPALDHVSFQVSASATVAIVAPGGA